MKVSHYFELEDTIVGGVKESVRHQRKALELHDIDYTEKPDLDADILHLNLMGPRSIFYALRARMKGVPVVAHTHITAEDFGNSFMFSNVLALPLKPYLRFAYSLADHLICPSEYNQEIIADYTDNDTTVVSNGVDTDKLEGFEELREEYLEKYDLEPPVVFNVGHVIKRKGLETFVETAREMPELDFAWFGPKDIGPKGRDTKKIIENAPDNCVFTGYIDDIRGGFAAGDIFFFPTHEENEGIALLESMSCGKAVLVRDIGTFDWLEDGENCLKADSGFREKLEELKDLELRKKLGENAEDTSKRFSLENVGSALKEVYENAL